MSQCSKKRRTQQDAEDTAAALSKPDEPVYAYPCILCRGHWHITSQPYHLLRKNPYLSQESANAEVPNA